MAKKKWLKVLSIISAFAVVCSVTNSVAPVFADGAASSPDMQALAEVAGIKVSNATTSEQLGEKLSEIGLPEGYSYGSITEFYKVNAFNGAVERDSSYDGAPSGDTVLVPGEEGALSALVNITGPNGAEVQTVTLKIEPEMKVYSFSSISNSLEDWTGDNSSGYKYNGGWVDKLVIPDEITNLADDWHNWQGQTCVVYGAGIRTVSRCAWFKAEVVSFKGNPTAIGPLAFHQGSNLKYIRLPDSVTSIGSEAFYNCTALEQLYMPKGLKTISENIFCKADDSASGYNLTEIIIPAGLDNLYAPTFYGAKKSCTITMLSRTDKPSWAVFYDEDEAHKAVCENLIIRAYPDSACYRYFYSVNPKVDLDNGLSLTEAAARASLSLGGFNAYYASSEAINAEEADIRAKIAESYFSVAGITSSWKNADWTYENNKWHNRLVLSKNGISAELPVALSASPEIASFIKDITAENNTTAESLAAAINEKLPAGITAEVSEFYKIKAIDGVVEKGSTYDGAVDGEILVPGTKGCVSAVITATTAGGTSVTRLNLAIEPAMNTVAYSSVCNSMAYWTGDNTNGYQYIGNAVDKLVVPDEITKLISGWWPNWHQGKDIKCVVFGKGITVIPKQTGLKAETVSFKGNVTTLEAGAFHSATNLKYLKLPETVTAIGEQAFRKCSALEALYLPDGLKFIGSNLFYVPAEDNTDGKLDPSKGYNISEITIPSGVTAISGGAFVGAASDCMITALTHSDRWSWTVFYDTSLDKSVAEHITVRAFSNDALYRYAYTVNEKVLLDDMTASEVFARVALKAGRFSDISFDTAEAVRAKSADILSEVSVAFGNLGGVTLGWEHDWEADNGFLFNNTLTVTKGEETLSVPFAVKKDGEFDLQQILDAAGYTVGNGTTENSLISEIKENGFADYEISVLDFYNLHAYNGAIERGSTYDGAPDEEVLVSGKKGYLAAVVSVKGNNGAERVCTLKYTIEPKIDVYSYESVSTDEDWEVDNDGVGSYFGTAQKIIVPDGVKALETNWIRWDNSVKCIVYGTGITTLPRMDGMNGLEVVLFKEGGKVETISDLAFYNATNLKYIELPNTLVTLGEEAFRFNTAMEQLRLPEGLVNINGPLFYKEDDSGFHNLTELVIPSTVNYIGNKAFSGAGKPCEVTILTTSHNLWNANVFYNSANPDRGKNYRLHVWKDSHQASADQKYQTAGPKKYLDSMGVCEAYTRSMRAAEELSGEAMENEEYTLLKLKKAFFAAPSISAEWANRVWEQNGSLIENRLVLSNGENTLSVPVSMLAKTGFYAGGAAILNAADFEANGSKQKLTFSFKFTSSAADKIEIEGVEYNIAEFGVVMKHISNSSTATGMDDSEFIIGASGVSVYKGTAGTVIRSENSDVNSFSACINNVPQGGRDYTFQCRGYIRYTDADGNIKTVYSDSYITSTRTVFDIMSVQSDYSAMSDWFNATIY